jgi:SAM-dependent methyltransferase
MSDPGDYFVQLERNRRLPWSLYHEPLERDVESFLRAVAADRPAARVLVIGCGLMQELDRAPEGLRFGVLDIDPRAVEAVRERGDPRVEECFVVAPETDLASLGRRFDAVYAKEVIEHIVAWRDYLGSLHRILEPEGWLWLSTPNYGEPWLPLLESTALEWVARRSGFTRKGLHPSRFSRGRLERGLREAGFADLKVRVVARRLALTAWGRRASGA